VIAYVETNFVLEVALLQDEHQDCLKILALAKKDSLRLVVPAVSLVEPYATLTRRRKERGQLCEVLSRELKHLIRSESYRRHKSAMDDIVSLLMRSGQEEKDRLNSAIRELLSVAEVIPLTADVVASALAFQTQPGLSPPDALVYASVRSHLDLAARGKSCFLNKNAKDFDVPDIQAALAQRGCKILFSFRDGFGYIKSQLEKP